MNLSFIFSFGSDSFSSPLSILLLFFLFFFCFSSSCNPLPYLHPGQSSHIFPHSSPSSFYPCLSFLFFLLLMSFILSYSLHLISGPSPHLCTLPKSVPSPTTSTPSISSRCPPPLTVAHPYRLLSLPLPPPTHARSPSSATSSAPSVACSPFTTYLRPKHAAEGQPTKVFRGRFQCWVRVIREGRTVGIRYHQAKWIFCAIFVRNTYPSSSSSPLLL